MNRVEASGVIPTGGRANLALPQAAVANGKLPAIACYISNSNATWLAVAQIPSASGDPYCGLSGTNTATPILTILNVPSGYYYYLIAIY